jgi:hypothetical protein
MVQSWAQKTDLLLLLSEPYSIKGTVWRDWRSLSIFSCSGFLGMAVTGRPQFCILQYYLCTYVRVCTEALELWWKELRQFTQIENKFQNVKQYAGILSVEPDSCTPLFLAIQTYKSAKWTVDSPDSLHCPRISTVLGERYPGPLKGQSHQILDYSLGYGKLN